MEGRANEGASHQCRPTAIHQTVGRGWSVVDVRAPEWASRVWADSEDGEGYEREGG